MQKFAAVPASITNNLNLERRRNRHCAFKQDL